jgi:hypothetical protein
MDYILSGSTPPNRLAPDIIRWRIFERAIILFKPTDIPARPLKFTIDSGNQGGLLFFQVLWYIFSLLSRAKISPELRHAHQTQ